MATVYVTMGKVGARGELSTDAMIYRGNTVRSETITSGATAEDGALVATKGDVAKVFCDTAVYATAGATPTAAASNSVFCEGGTSTFIALQEGDKISVIDA